MASVKKTRGTKAPQYQAWLKQHLKEATAEYKRIQKLEKKQETNRDLYEQVHQMWGYLAGLEKCLKEYALFRSAPDS